MDLSKLKLAEEVPDHDVCINNMCGVAQSWDWMRAWPGMTTIANTVMNDNTAICAVRPLCTCNIVLLEKYAICCVTPVVSEPDIQICLHRCHFWTGIAPIRGKSIGLTMNLQHRYWA